VVNMYTNLRCMLYVVKLVIKPIIFSPVSRQLALTWQAVCTKIVVHGLKCYHPSMAHFICIHCVSVTLTFDLFSPIKFDLVFLLLTSIAMATILCLTLREVVVLILAPSMKLMRPSIMKLWHLLPVKYR